LVASDRTLTYAELNEDANRVANSLIGLGVKPRSNVLIMLGRDSNLISAILGVLKAGCAFVPIDPEYPQDRIDYIYENCHADYIITDNIGDATLDINDLLKCENVDNPDVIIDSSDIAYMIYTSGSTGKPKGIMISHMNITNLFSKQEGNLLNDLYSRMDRVIALSTVSFDAFLLDFMSLTFGLTIILANDSEVKNIDELAQLMHRENPDAIAITTPSRAMQYLENKNFKNEFASIKHIGVGGEMLPKELVRSILENYDAEIYNMYGPTEITITSNTTRITNTDNINVGKALYNYITEIRDIDGKVLPKGVMGELYIGGYGVAGGYYGMEDKTNEVFCEINGIPYYKSGDLAVELPDGEIVIKGRLDDQIKLRGLRIEIGEIESNISKYLGIKQSIVVVKEINNNEHLCAYFTADGEIDSAELKDFLKDKLTKYMVPTVFMQIDEMPYTPNGKIDFKQLPEPVLKLENVKPVNETEEKLFEIISDFINNDEFGTTDDLYALGFTSLTLMKLNSLIYNEMDVNINISVLFNNPTIKSISDEMIMGDGFKFDIDGLIDAAKDIEYYPLTENQLGVYYECMQSPGEIKYTMPTVVKFDNSVDANKLKESVIKTVESHPYLKVRIVVSDDGSLKQKRDDNILMDEIDIVKVDSISDGELMKNDVRAFTLNNSQLFRFKIYDTNDGVVLFSDFHHIITDGVSQNMFFNEIVSVYNGEDIERETVDGYVYSLIEEKLVDGEKYNQSKKFFQDKMVDEVESTVLTPNLNGNPDEGKIKNVSDSIDSKVVKKFCKDNVVSQNAL
ncbi:non-ribosomal peptide synthetase, partial [uncultured Methanobrevibacter sp.]|uniref:non-ribosomal peptide synthetase n=1 Tax=uncultured Methanobrevibacter sp. TaxID=253161 RepID=UPI0025FC6793